MFGSAVWEEGDSYPLKALTQRLAVLYDGRWWKRLLKEIDQTQSWQAINWLGEVEVTPAVSTVPSSLDEDFKAYINPPGACVPNINSLHNDVFYVAGTARPGEKTQV